ncbi:ATP-binding protein [Glaciecola petra]|uniref:histidine kinase n=1 Tax=Glaciecola petra TaxID=3075602 RepID=A0ABU2ZSA7_9ALTE|nr:ATP-binding protein [Aestuariibacter sp. P117]MDT0595512.1 ATP-binding protein [Aestuariibacter sp. P117]
MKAFHFLSKLNPRNSLLGRIFVWFWVAVTIMVICTFVVSRYLGQAWEVSTLSPQQLKRATNAQNNVQKILQRTPEINRALRRTSNREPWQLMAISKKNQKLVLGFPPPLLPQRDRFIALVNAPEPYLIRANNMEFYGPLTLNHRGEEYALFIGKLLARRDRPADAIAWSLAVFILLGTVACVAIAYTIAKPIHRLRSLSNGFAKGAQPAPDKALYNRKDELGELHNDIYSMANKLANSLEQQKSLMANISHELRTPLTRLQLAVAMLDSDSATQRTRDSSKEETSKRRSYSERVEKEIALMDGLIGQALQLARFNDEAHEQWAHKKVLPINEALKPIVDDLVFEAKGLNINLKFESETDVSLAINTISFTSAIENVVRNAIKYAKQNVLIKVSNESSGSSSDSKNKISDRVVISVHDDGDGLNDFPESEQIFQPFYRASSSEDKQGTGLGLAIAKAAMEQHSGKISLNTSILGGLQIDLSFPIKSN